TDVLQAVSHQRLPPPHHHCPSIQIIWCRFTQTAALALGLPARLDKLAEVLELACRKDVSGQRLMMMMARPRRAHKGEDTTQTFYFCDDDRLQRLFAYCEEDVRVTREIFSRLPELSPQEQKLWELDACINHRGFFVDVVLAQAAHQIALAAGPEINTELATVTDGAVSSVHQIAKLQGWLAQHGCTSKSLDK